MPVKNIPIVVLGGTGYVAGELTRLLLQHPYFDLRSVVSASESGQLIKLKFPFLGPAIGDRTFDSQEQGFSHLRKGGTIGLFSALPHGESAMQIAKWCSAAEEVGSDLRIVDLSSDFRFATSEAYQAVYGKPHEAPHLLDSFQCVLPDLPHNSVGNSISHPGCFTTSVVLGAAPLLELGVIENHVVANCITGSTGAGRQPRPGTHHPERHGGLWAYDPLQHRHQPEMVNLLRDASGIDVSVSFLPHSGPFARGIHSSLFARFTSSMSEDNLRSKIAEYYAGTPFVKVLDGWPSVKEATGSNMCYLGIRMMDGQVFVASVIDNLTKGAAGGGVQWMNELFAFEPAEGLLNPGVGWC